MEKSTSSSSVFCLSGRISPIVLWKGRWTLVAGRARWASRPLKVNMGHELRVRRACRSGGNGQL